MLPDDVLHDRLGIRRIIGVNRQVERLGNGARSFLGAPIGRRIHSVDTGDDVGVSELTSQFRNAPLAGGAQAGIVGRLGGLFRMPHEDDGRRRLGLEEPGQTHRNRGIDDDDLNATAATTPAPLILGLWFAHGERLYGFSSPLTT